MRDELLEEKIEDTQHLEPARGSRLLTLGLNRGRRRYPGDRNPL